MLRYTTTFKKDTLSALAAKRVVVSREELEVIENGGEASVLASVPSAAANNASGGPLSGFSSSLLRDLRRGLLSGLLIGLFGS